MAWDDYAPAVADDEEERQRLLRSVGASDQGPPPVEPPKMQLASAAGDYTPVLPTAGSTADLESRAARPRTMPQSLAAPEVGSTEDLEAHAAKPRTSVQEAMTPAEPRPQWKDYAPPEPHGWAKFGHVMAGLTRPTNEVFNVQPEKRAEVAYKNAVGEYEAPLGEEKTKAETEHAQAGAELERAQAHAAENPSDWKGQPGILNDQGAPLELNEKTGQYRWGNVAGAKPIKTPSETATQHELDMENVGSKIGFSGDPKKIQQEINAAVASGKITQQQASDYVSHRMLKGDQGTKVTVPIEVHSGEEATDLDKAFTGKEVIVHGPNGSRTQMSYGDAKAQKIPLDQMTILNAKEAQDNRDKYASIDATMNSLKTYRNDFKQFAPKLVPKDRDAMRVLSDHSTNGHMAGLLGGMFDDIPLAGPVNQYVNKLMNGTMTSDQYNQLSPEGKKLVADYFNQLVSNFANMKAVLGSMGRNPAQIQAEINRVPLPYLDWQSADNLFNATRDDIRTRAGSMPEIH